MDHSLKPMLPLETLRGFEAAARTGSFSAAAEHLNITHGAISRQIAKLEGWLGLKLFERGARGVVADAGGPAALPAHQRGLRADIRHDRPLERAARRGGGAAHLDPLGQRAVADAAAARAGKRADAAAHRARRRQPSGRSRRRGDRPVDPLRPRQDSQAGFPCSCSRSTAFRSPRRSWRRRSAEGSRSGC